MFKAERERERVSFSHKRHVYVTISEEYPKEEEMEKRWTMDQKMKNFLKDGPKKEQIWTSENYCARFVLTLPTPSKTTTFKRYETKNNESTFTERRLLRGGTYVLK